MTDFGVVANVKVGPDSLGVQVPEWRGKRQFRRFRGRIRNREHWRWAQRQRYHPRRAINWNAFFGAEVCDGLATQICKAEDERIMQELCATLDQPTPATEVV